MLGCPLLGVLVGVDTLRESLCFGASPLSWFLSSWMRPWTFSKTADVSATVLPIPKSQKPTPIAPKIHTLPAFVTSVTAGPVHGNESAVVLGMTILGVSQFG